MYKNRLNLRDVIAIAIFLVGSATMFAQETGVVINGVKWATRNVDTPGTFAEKPESPGMFYQWNRITAWTTIGNIWATTGNLSDWDSSNPNGTIWEKSNDPSPAGWRLPTFEEIEQLLDKVKVDNEFVNVNGVRGNRFTDKVTGNSIFMPFVGCIDGQSGSLEASVSIYWSSTPMGDNMRTLVLAIGLTNKGNSQRKNGLLVRCVTE